MESEKEGKRVLKNLQNGNEWDLVWVSLLEEEKKMVKLRKRTMYICRKNETVKGNQGMA